MRYLARGAEDRPIVKMRMAVPHAKSKIEFLTLSHTGRPHISIWRSVIEMIKSLAITMIQTYCSLRPPLSWLSIQWSLLLSDSMSTSSWSLLKSKWWVLRHMSNAMHRHRTSSVYFNVFKMSSSSQFRANNSALLSHRHVNSLSSPVWPNLPRSLFRSGLTYTQANMKRFRVARSAALTLCATCRFNGRTGSESRMPKLNSSMHLCNKSA